MILYIFLIAVANIGIGLMLSRRLGRVYRERCNLTGPNSVEAESSDFDESWDDSEEPPELEEPADSSSAESHEEDLEPELASV